MLYTITITGLNASHLDAALEGLIELAGNGVLELTTIEAVHS